MQIKRFEARNMTDALRQIKRELGPEAVILSAKDLRRENRLLGISRKIGVEVTAAVDDDYPRTSFNRNIGEKALNKGENHSLSTDKTIPKQAQERAVHKTDDIFKLKAFAAHAARRYQTLKPANRTAEHRDMGHPAVMDAEQDRVNQTSDFGVGRYLAKSGLTVGSLRLSENGPTLISLVGNAGVGKTTTLAKLAAAFKMAENEAVGLLTLDRYRIGGLAQLQCYADSMQLSLASPTNDDDLRKAMKRLKHCRIILIDTPSVHPKDPQRVEALQAQFQCLGGVQPLLVVSAESREEDLNDTLRRFAPLTPVGTVITKTDMTHNYEDLVNFLCRQGLAVYYCSSGPRVPFDLEKATIETLTNRFLPHDAGKSHEGGEDVYPVAAGIDRGDPVSGTYLANKNSDIFHRPECKWIRLINRTNIVEFSSFAEALNHRFKPCRYCNPQHLSITGILSRERAAL